MSSKREIFALTFLCYTSVHALRTAYSEAKVNIEREIEVQSRMMGILDSLMLLFLGIGHFIHAISPIKRPVRSLWIAMVACSINYGAMPMLLNLKPFCNFYYLSLFMILNGFLQSYCWPTLLMIINSRYSSKENSTLLGFWSTNANFGNIIGYFVFQVMNLSWQISLIMIGFYALINGFLTLRMKEIPSGRKQQNSSSLSDSQLKSDISDQLTQSLASQPGKNGIGAINKKSEIKEDISHQNKDMGHQTTAMSNSSTLKDPRIILITICFSLIKSIIYGIMLWVIIVIIKLPLYFKTKEGSKEYASSIPITYDLLAICGSVFIGYLFIKIINKGLLMIPFMVILILCFFCLRFLSLGVIFVFCIIGTVGFCLGGIFNTLAGLVVIELTSLIPDHLKSSSLAFYSAITMAAGNITTAATQVLIGFVIGKEHQEGIFLIFMVYSSLCLLCLIMISIISTRRPSIPQSEGNKCRQRKQEEIKTEVKHNLSLTISGYSHNHTQHKNRLLIEQTSQASINPSELTRCPSLYLQESLLTNNSNYVGPYENYSVRR